MASSLDGGQLTDLSREIQELLVDEGRLEALARDTGARFSGLKDIDVLLGLARAKLRLCLALMKRAPGDFAARQASISRRARDAIRIVESLVTENISEDQRGIVQGSALFAEVKKLFEEFLVSGGGGYLEGREIDDRKRRILARVVATAIRKYMGSDDRYPPLEIENYPPLMQKLLLALFPVFIRLRPQKPPYGIEEGEEQLYHSRSMRVPISQAITYMEDELLPELERRQEASPGDPDIQEQIRQVREKLDIYRSLRVTPRSTPVLLEKGFHTEGMTGFTQDGEMLVSIPLAVSFKSGTNLDRKMELVRMDTVRRLAGRGVSAELDEEYRRLRSIESGIRGSSRTPSFKVDPGWGSWVLRQDFPFLARLSDKEAFQALVRIVQSGSLRGAQRRLAALLSENRAETKLPG